MELYISDLDGTLLTPEATLSNYTRAVLKALVDSQVYFSVATARSPSTVRHLLEGLTFSVPIVVMNGACLYDVKKNRIIRTEKLSKEALQDLLRIIKKHKMDGFIYTVENNDVFIWYERLETDETRNFLKERETIYNLGRLDDFAQDLSGKTIINYTITGTKHRLNSLYQDLTQSDRFRVIYYEDVYNSDCYFLEVYAAQASKYHAVQQLRTQYGFSKITCFGDNLNDLPLFMASDICLAVANAKPEIKEAADVIIASNMEDGVARWLYERFLADKSLLLPDKLENS